MTDEELDILASAYLDGEAGPDEVALVEADPALQARVEEFRALSTMLSTVTPPAAELRDRHLAAALDTVYAEDTVYVEDADYAEDTAYARPAAAVDEAVAAPASEPVKVAASESVIDLTERRARKQAAMPRWLAPAAGLMLMAGAGWFLINNGGSNDDTSADEAAADMATDSGGAENESMVMDDSTDAGGMTAATEAEGADAMSDTADRLDGDEPEQADPASGDAAAAADDAATEDAAADESAETSVAPLVSTTTMADAESPATTYRLYDADETLTMVNVDLAELAIDATVPWGDPVLANCSGGPVDVVTRGEPTGYLPVEVDGRRLEVLRYQVDSGTTPRLYLVDESCRVLDANS